MTDVLSVLLLVIAVAGCAGWAVFLWVLINRMADWNDVRRKRAAAYRARHLR